VYSHAGSYPGANYATQEQQQSHYPPQDWNPNPIPDASYFEQAGNIPGGLPSHDQDSLWYQDQKPPHQYYFSYGH